MRVHETLERDQNPEKFTRPVEENFVKAHQSSKRGSKELRYLLFTKIQQQVLDTRKRENFSLTGSIEICQTYDTIN